MTNFNFQGKIIRHFWGKLIRQSTVNLHILTPVYNLLPGGGCLNYQNGSLIITFFHRALKE